MSWSETVEVICKTDKAVLCRYEGVEAWVPFSQIMDDSEVYNASEPGDQANLAIPEWLAEQKGWMI